MLSFFMPVGADMKMVDFRCANCGRLLAKTNGDTEVKCPRCGAVNKYIMASGKVEYTPKTARRTASDEHASHRSTSSGATFND